LDNGIVGILVALGSATREQKEVDDVR
jgi:hypothetical protein